MSNKTEKRSKLELRLEKALQEIEALKSTLTETRAGTYQRQQCQLYFQAGV